MNIERISPSKENIEDILEHLANWDIEDIILTQETIDLTKPGDEWKTLRPGRRTVTIKEVDNYSK